MKKFFSLLIILLSLTTLSSCDLSFSDPDISIDGIFNDDTTITQTQTEITKLYSEVEDMCVAVEAISATSAGSGSGLIYRIVDSKTNAEVKEDTKDLDVYVVTNEHVVAGGSNYRVYVEEKSYYNADLVGTDKSNDLAVLKFSMKNSGNTSVKEYPLFNNEINIPTVGALCLAIGSPLGVHNFNFPSLGLVSKVTLNDIIHSCSINPGNSGGPLFDISGQLLGINVSKIIYTQSTDSEGNLIKIPVADINYTIPTWTVKSVIEVIEQSSGEIVRPKLGVTTKEVIASIDDNTNTLLPPIRNYGVVVVEVVANSNAANLKSEDSKYKGLLPNDVILNVNDIEITRNNDLLQILNTSKIGDNFNVTIMRKISDSWTQIKLKCKLK